MDEPRNGHVLSLFEDGVTLREAIGPEGAENFRQTGGEVFGRGLQLGHDGVHEGVRLGRFGGFFDDGETGPGSDQKGVLEQLLRRLGEGTQPLGGEVATEEIGEESGGLLAQG